MGSGLRRTAFDQASYTYWTGKYGLVNVKDFGAVGDGVHDDTAAIQRALRIGGQVFIPPGTYIISSTLALGIQGTQLVGADQTVKWFNNTTVVLEPASNFVGDAVISVTANYTMISGFTISRPDTALTIPAIVMSATGNSLQRLNITNLGGVEWNGASRFIAEDVVCTYTGAYGFNLQNATIGFLTRCNAAPNGNNTNPTSYNLNGCESINGMNCEANNTPDFALQLTSTNDSEFYDFEGNGASNIQISLNGCNDIAFHHTYLDGGANHWLIENSTSIQLIGGYCIGSNGYSLRLDGGSGACHGVHVIGLTLQTDSTTESVIEVQNTNYNHLIIGNRLNGGAHGIDDQNSDAYGRLYIANNIENGVSYNTSTVGGMVLALNPGANPAGQLTLPASPLVSGTVYQNATPYTITIYQPAYATTSGTAGSVAVALGSSSSPSTLFTQWVNGSTTSTLPEVIQLRVPPGWYYSFTITGATLANAQIQGE